MRAIAVDDDAQMHQLLRDSLSIIDADVDLIACASTKASGVNLIEQHQPDLLFLDIDLPDGTGFDLLEALNDYGRYLIIFISGHGEHGRRALAFEALDYLDKPLLLDDLEVALERAQRRFAQRNYAERMADIQVALRNFRQEILPKRLIISNSDGFHFLKITSIVYIKGGRDVVAIVMLDGKKIIKSARLTYYVEQFKPYREFKKVNRYYLVNLRHVVSITTGPELNLVNDHKIAISHAMSQEIRRDLEQLGEDTVTE